MIIIICLSSFIFHTCFILFRVAYSGCHRGRGRVLSGQVASLSLGQHKDIWDKQPCTLTVTPTVNFKWPIHQTYMFLDCWSTWRKPTHARWECAYSTQKGLSQNSSQGHFYCQGTVLTKTPPCTAAPHYQALNLGSILGSRFNSYFTQVAVPLPTV